MSDQVHKKVRVLAVSHLASRGGAQKCLLTLCKAIDRERFDIAVAMPKEGNLSEDFRALGVPVHRARMKWWVGTRGSEAMMRADFWSDLELRVDALSSLIAREEIDLVVSNSSVIVEGALSAARCGVPHIWHILEMMSRDPGLRPIYPLAVFYWLLGRLSDEVVAPSESVREEIVRHWPTATPRLIHTGIEALDRASLRRPKSLLFGIQDSDPVVCFVGELSERKGVRNLVQAMPLICSANPQAHLAIVGADRGELRRAQRLARRSGVADRVLFMGERADALEIIASSDVVALPSLSDPFPIVLLEAMATGVPAVATRSGGASEMEVHGETGLLVAPGSVDELGGSVGALLGDASLRARMGIAARERARALYSPEKYAHAFEELFTRSVARRGEREDAHALSDLLVAGSSASRILSPGWSLSELAWILRSIGLRLLRRKQSQQG